MQVARVHRRRGGIVRLLEAVALVEEDGLLRVEEVEDVHEEVDLHGTERERIAEVQIEVVVRGRAAFVAARRQEDSIAAASLVTVISVFVEMWRFALRLVSFPSPTATPFCVSRENPCSVNVRT